MPEAYSQQNSTPSKNEVNSKQNSTPSKNETNSKQSSTPLNNSQPNERSLSQDLLAEGMVQRAVENKRDEKIEEIFKYSGSDKNVPPKLIMPILSNA